MTHILSIIPTLNSADSLNLTLASLREAYRAGLSAGWVICDGGSQDLTCELAKKAGCRIVTGAKGRGAQLALGAGAGLRAFPNADWLLFLHADTQLEAGWTGPVRQFCESQSHHFKAGYFRFMLDDLSSSAKRLEHAVDWRCKFLALPYGDQGLLISKHFYQSLGGFKPWPLFEDVDLIRRIGRSRLCALSPRAQTSSQRYRQQGYLKRSAKNLILLSQYFMGADPQSLARQYRS